MKAVCPRRIDLKWRTVPGGAVDDHLTVGRKARHADIAVTKRELPESGFLADGAGCAVPIGYDEHANKQAQHGGRQPGQPACSPSLILWRRHEFWDIVLVSERKANVSDIANPFLWILLQALFDEHQQQRRQLGQLAPIRLRLEHAGDRLRHVFPKKRRLPGEHLVENDAESPDVGTRVDRPAARLLGAHVRRRAENDPGLGQRGRGQYRRFRSARSNHLIRALRDTEIEDFDDTVCAQLDICWLQVTVNDGVRMRGLDCI